MPKWNPYFAYCKGCSKLFQGALCPSCDCAPSARLTVNLRRA